MSISHAWVAGSTMLMCVWEKVGGKHAGVLMSVYLGGREEREREIKETYLNECVSFAVINFQNWSHVSTTITIIRRTKYSDHLLLLSPQITIIRKIHATLNWNINRTGLKSCEKAFTWPQLYPSITSWWALAISFKLLVWLNCSDMSCSNN